MKTIELKRAFLGLVAVVWATAAPANAATDVVTDDRFNALAASAKAQMQIDPNRAIAEANQAREQAAVARDLHQRAIMRATADWLAGEAMTRLGDNRRAAPLVSSALRQVHDIARNSKLHGDILLSQGSILTATGDVSGALRDLQAAHRIFQHVGDSRSQAKALIQIAMMYYDANDFENAIKYERQAGETVSLDPGIAVSVHNGIGNALKELGRYREAQEEFKVAIATARQMNSPLLTATVLNNSARVSLLTGNLDAAARSIAESLAVAETQSVPQFRNQQLALRAQLDLQRGALERARSVVAQIFGDRDLVRTTLADREAHRTAYEVYHRLDQPALALAHLAALKRLDDDATTLARSNSAALMSARFDFANQDLRIAKLKADDLQKSVGFERARARAQRLVFGGVVTAILAIVGLLMVALIAIRRSRNEVRAANDNLEAGNAALAKALAAKSEFLAVTSHEIRTPLNGILGMTQVMLADRSLDAIVRERVGLVHGAGTTMRALVDDILDVAKIETGNLTLESMPFDLRGLVRDACRLWEQQIADKGIDFAIEVDQAPGLILGDPARLRQILFNLLGNAVKFTAAGRIRVIAGRDEDGTFTVTVSDSGVGIPPDKQAVIFESFKQADAGTTRQFGGTGLGLAICRSLAQAMGGDVSVESEPGIGADFTLTLPLVPALPVADDSAPIAAPTYLIVDRNPISRAMYRALLGEVVPSIDAVEDVAIALATMRRCSVAGILVDEATLRLAGEPTAIARDLVEAAAGAPVSILWPVADLDTGCLVTTGASLLTKPVARAQLISHVTAQLVAYGNPLLVTQAA